ncbi:hypothetical protein OS493_035219 [Desmophyllum pertusum]|uniref:Uncharacterized protein n=1 Tax=Desmophyllum pertusum TaxID=174260 RepID=A0A9W9ZXC0_9CNID|nr:hypothetical protein OS493_035219 [Desmophyllum pertusum]
MQLCHYKDELTEIQLREKYRQQSTKAQTCVFMKATELDMPMMMLNGSSTANSSFGSDAFTCLKAFKEKSLPKIFRTLHFARLYKLPYIDYLDDYNPYFCANQRDPGATGNGTCYGVKASQQHAE